MAEQIPSSYDTRAQGLQNFQGSQQAASNLKVAPAPPTIASLIEEIDEDNTRLANMVRASIALGDRLHGCETEEVGKGNPVAPESTNLIDRLHGRRSRTNTLICQLEYALSRIDRGL